MFKNKYECQLELIKDSYNDAKSSFDNYNKKISNRMTIISILFSGVVLLMKSYIDSSKESRAFADYKFIIMIVIASLMIINILLLIFPLKSKNICLLTNIDNQILLMDDDNIENKIAIMVLAYTNNIFAIEKENKVKAVMLYISTALLILSLLLFLILLICLCF